MKFLKVVNQNQRKVLSMKGNLFLLAIAALALTSCEEKRPEGSKKTHVTDYDTPVNTRDRDSRVGTSMNQSDVDADSQITQSIREAIVQDNGISPNGKNIRIITVERIVTLRGPVATPEEKANLQKKAENVRGVKKVNNQLEVAR